MDIDEPWFQDYTDISNLIQLYGPHGQNYEDSSVVKALDGTANTDFRSEALP